MPDETQQPLEREVESLLARVHELLRGAGRKSLRANATANGVYISLTARRVKPPKPADADLVNVPHGLARERRAVKRLFCFIRDQRAVMGGDDLVLNSGALETMLRVKYPEDDMAIDTVRHALADLRKKGFVWVHPQNGYYTGSQPSLPFFARQPDELSERADAG
ncbi:hypothetical protein VT84_13740 [Gemmata sp. SH-PL17]|uniref:hypothetical protein n=1 Tax=Gemmata sp. SH-PL17 TaxID=1630693 RepID=UPI00078E0E88|nr:hypothetical protein [Gemmata sp. SH-PL17]AMV25455.1 hypothetical protein VT84_13740 [Gemmata sp. SH-PL17]